jgi:hypothetical protein
MANKRRTLKRRKIGGGIGESNPVNTGIVNNATKEEPTTDDVRSTETVSQTPQTPDKPWYRRWFGLGGKRKTNKRKSKRNTSQQKR